MNMLLIVIVTGALSAVVVSVMGFLGTMHDLRANAPQVYERTPHPAETALEWAVLDTDVPIEQVVRLAEEKARQR